MSRFVNMHGVGTKTGQKWVQMVCLGLHVMVVTQLPNDVSTVFEFLYHFSFLVGSEDSGGCQNQSILDATTDYWIEVLR
jgi:hypothetical protein